MRVFVTGGAGFIGSHVTKLLIEAGHQVSVLDNLSAGRKSNLPPGVAFIRGDLKQDKLAEWVTGHDAVMHFAAYTPVPRSVEEPVAFAQNNVVNTVRLLEAMRNTGIRRVVFSSSATVYGEPKRLPLREDDPIGAQNNPYGASKVSAEAFVTAFARLYNFDATLLRYFNPYGTNEYCEPETHLIPNIVRAALTDEPVPLYWKGEQIRDFIYIEDLARAHIAVLEAKGFNVFNVGTEKGTKVKEILQIVTDIVGHPLRIADLGERRGDVAAYYATAERLRTMFGWEAQVDLEEGLRRTVAFFKERLEKEASGGGRTRR